MQVIYRVQYFAPFMVASSAYGGSQPLYGGIYMVERYNERIFYPTWVSA
jgi:hypothetical protein